LGKIACAKKLKKILFSVAYLLKTGTFAAGIGSGQCTAYHISTPLPSRVRAHANQSFMEPILANFI
jgi:FtsZ-interacting cell division protein ZipA